MPKLKTSAGFWSEILTIGLYKPNQGRLTRQLTALGLALLVFIGAYTAAETWLMSYDPAVRIGIPCAVSFIGAWLIFRVVNHPPFADFLISVEGEMDKVSWASKTELYRGTIVVIVTMVFLGAVLYVYDILWYQILAALRVLRI